MRFATKNSTQNHKRKNRENLRPRCNLGCSSYLFETW